MRRCENLLGSAYLKLTQAASHRFKKFNLFLYKEQIYRVYSLYPAIFTITLNHHCIKAISS